MVCMVKSKRDNESEFFRVDSGKHLPRVVNVFFYVTNRCETKGIEHD